MEQQWSHAIEISLGARVLDNLALLNPRNWWGGYQIINTYSPLDSTLIAETLVRVILPVILLLILSAHSSLAPPAPKVAALVGLVSPWSVGSVSRVLPQLLKQAQIIRSWKTMRSPPLPEAISCLEDRIDRNRAYRTRQYDIYLPPTPTNDVMGDGEKEPPSHHHALLLLPGALIDHESYSEIAARISDAGIFVVVLSLEPMRMASKHLGKTSIKSLVRLTQQVSKKHPQIHNWSIAGHSFGGYRVAELVAAEATTNEGLSTLLPFQKFILWASPAVNQLLSLPSQANKQRIRLLSIEGENDPTRFLMDGAYGSLSVILKDFPHASEVILKGACHSQFGSYRVANHSNEPNHWTHMDIATISRQEQQEQIGNHTVTFLYRE